jgi:hypothetical protein
MPETNEYKSDILITPFVTAVNKGEGKFDITCKKSGKHFMLKANSAEEANVWVTKINRVVEASTK